MSKSHIVYLQHILEECNFVTSVVTENLPMYQFLSDETLKRAIARSLEIIGEATKKYRPMLNMNGKIFHGNKWPVCVIN